MSKKKRNKSAGSQVRQNEKYQSFLVSPEAYDMMCCDGYTRLSDNPEVQMAVNYIADLLSSMTIYLMRNTNKGDVRIKNELSKKVDINPYSLMTRKAWMFNIVRNMLIDGNQTVYPETENGYLKDLVPLEPALTSYRKNGKSYVVQYGDRQYNPDEVLHFVNNPNPSAPWMGMGYRAALKDVIQNLKQAAATKNGFMSSKWKPSVIVKVDALTDEFSSPEGRQKLMDEYIKGSRAGDPWMIPAEQFSIEQIKPLSLNDLAINDTVIIDKKTVARMIGVPPYVTGVGEFNKDEHRAFINTKIMPTAQIIHQELTRKLLISTELYFMMSSRALYGYDMQEMARVGQELYVRGIVTGNEVRGWLNMTPTEGLDERVILENYIPAGMIGDQKKLNQQGEENG